MQLDTSRLCVVCGRHDAAGKGEKRKSGYKCAPCIGKKSKSLYRSLSAGKFDKLLRSLPASQPATSTSGSVVASGSSGSASGSGAAASAVGLSEVPQGTSQRSHPQSAAGHSHLALPQALVAVGRQNEVASYLTPGEYHMAPPHGVQSPAKHAASPEELDRYLSGVITRQPLQPVSAPASTCIESTTTSTFDDLPDHSPPVPGAPHMPPGPCRWERQLQAAHALVAAPAPTPAGPPRPDAPPRGFVEARPQPAARAQHQHQPAHVSMTTVADTEGHPAAPAPAAPRDASHSEPQSLGGDSVGVESSMVSGDSNDIVVHAVPGRPLDFSLDLGGGGVSASKGAAARRPLAPSVPSSTVSSVALRVPQQPAHPVGLREDSVRGGAPPPRAHGGGGNDAATAVTQSSSEPVSVRWEQLGIQPASPLSASPEDRPADAPRPVTVARATDGSVGPPAATSPQLRPSTFHGHAACPATASTAASISAQPLDAAASHTTKSSNSSITAGTPRVHAAPPAMAAPAFTVPPRQQQQQQHHASWDLGVVDTQTLPAAPARAAVHDTEAVRPAAVPAASARDFAVQTGEAPGVLMPAHATATATAGATHQEQVDLAAAELLAASGFDLGLGREGGGGGRAVWGRNGRAHAHHPARQSRGIPHHARGSRHAPRRVGGGSIDGGGGGSVILDDATTALIDRIHGAIVDGDGGDSIAPESPSAPAAAYHPRAGPQPRGALGDLPINRPLHGGGTPAGAKRPQQQQQHHRRGAGRTRSRSRSASVGAAWGGGGGWGHPAARHHRDLHHHAEFARSPSPPLSDVPDYAVSPPAQQQQRQRGHHDARHHNHDHAQHTHTHTRRWGGRVDPSDQVLDLVPEEEGGALGGARGRGGERRYQHQHQRHSRARTDDEDMRYARGGAPQAQGHHGRQRGRNPLVDSDEEWGPTPASRGRPHHAPAAWGWDAQQQQQHSHGPHDFSALPSRAYSRGDAVSDPNRSCSVSLTDALQYTRAAVHPHASKAAGPAHRYPPSAPESDTDYEDHPSLGGVRGVGPRHVEHGRHGPPRAAGDLHFDSPEHPIAPFAMYAPQRPPQGGVVRGRRGSVPL